MTVPQSAQSLMISDQSPALVAASDWSVNPDKRWLVRAERNSRCYVVSPPEPLSDPFTLPERLRQSCPAGSIFLGVDFPLGWPITYARQTGFSSFRAALSKLGRGKWASYYSRTDEPCLHQPFFPASPHSKGQLRQKLAKGIGMNHPQQLLRRCEQRTKYRSAAQSLFFTCGAQQVGAAANVGWKQFLQPHREDLLIWPFDGSLEYLLSQPQLTVAEVYPAEAYRHLRLALGSGSGHSKTRRRDRVLLCSELRSYIQGFPIELAAAAESWWETGFLNDDQFDATVALIQMLLVLLGVLPAVHPADPEIINWEGWIMGLSPDDFM